MNNEEVKPTEKVKNAPEETVPSLPKVPTMPVPEEMSRPKMRQVLIETDGTVVRIIKNESAGSLELISILQALLQSFSQR